MNSKVQCPIHNKPLTLRRHPEGDSESGIPCYVATCECDKEDTKWFGKEVVRTFDISKPEARPMPTSAKESSK